jgi:hypothetical protein
MAYIQRTTLGANVMHGSNHTVLEKYRGPGAMARAIAHIEHTHHNSKTKPKHRGKAACKRAQKKGACAPQDCGSGGTKWAKGTRSEGGQMVLHRDAVATQPIRKAAQAILRELRANGGPLARRDLLAVRGVGPKTYPKAIELLRTQCSVKVTGKGPKMRYSAA